MQSGRSLRLDNAKGALIILVVLGHFLWQYREDAGVSTLVLASMCSICRLSSSYPGT